MNTPRSFRPNGFGPVGADGSARYRVRCVLAQLEARAREGRTNQRWYRDFSPSVPKGQGAFFTLLAKYRKTVRLYEKAGCHPKMTLIFYEKHNTSMRR